MNDPYQILFFHFRSVGPKCNRQYPLAARVNAPRPVMCLRGAKESIYFISIIVQYIFLCRDNLDIFLLIFPKAKSLILNMFNIIENIF